MLVIRRVVRIEWADCDPAGIVFHPRYFEMFDTSTHHLFEAAGWKKRDLLSEFGAAGYPVVDTRARFLASAAYGDDVVIETQAAAFRHSSFDVEHKVFRLDADGERLAVEARATRVWVGAHPDDPKQVKAQPIPPILIARLSGQSEAADGG